FSRDGKLLASTCGNAPSTTRPGAGGLRLWDTATWKEQMPQAGHEHLVFTVAFSPGGETVGTASQDGTIKLWSVPGTGGVAPRRGVGQGQVPSPDNRSTGLGNAIGPQGGEEADSPTPQKTMVQIWLALGVAMLVAVPLCLVLWRHLRPGRQEAVAHIPFRCSACKRSLKAKTALAGKKIKCPQCAQAVEVPVVLDKKG